MYHFTFFYLIQGSARGPKFCRSQSDSESFSPDGPVSSLCKIDSHAQILVGEQLDINHWLGKMGNFFFCNWNQIEYLLNFQIYGFVSVVFHGINVKATHLATFVRIMEELIFKILRVKP